MTLNIENERAVEALTISLKKCLRFVNHIAFREVVKEAEEALKLAGKISDVNPIPK